LENAGGARTSPRLPVRDRLAVRGT
jgi:hypothetical protein